jgi:hypothetical protein
VLEIDKLNFSTQNVDNYRFAAKKALKRLFGVVKAYFLSISHHPAARQSGAAP